MAEGKASGSYRRREHLVFFAVSYLLGAAGLVALALATRSVSVGLPVGFAVMALLLILLSWRTIRVAVIAAPEAVIVRNVLRERHIPWEDVARFDWGRHRGFAIGGVWLNDGRFLRAFALNPPFGPGSAVPRALAGLNGELATVSGKPVEMPHQLSDADQELLATARRLSGEDSLILMEQLRRLGSDEERAACLRAELARRREQS